MSRRDDEIMKSLGRLEARAESTHEYIVNVSTKLNRHVEDKELHAQSGLHLEVPHAVGAGGLLTLLGGVVHWLSGLVHAKPPTQP